jgi:PKD repeat protein
MALFDYKREFVHGIIAQEIDPNGGVAVTADRIYWGINGGGVPSSPYAIHYYQMDGTPEGGLTLSNPTGTGINGFAVDDTYIYVLRGDILQRYSISTGLRVDEFSPSVNFPETIEVDDTRIFITDNTNNRIAIYNKSTFAFITNLTPIGAANGARNIALDGDYIYISNTTDDNIYIYDQSTYVYVATINTLDSVSSIGVDQGYLYIRTSTSETRIFNKTSPYAYVQSIAYSGQFRGGTVAVNGEVYLPSSFIGPFKVYQGIGGVSADPTDLTVTCSIPAPPVASFNAEISIDKTVAKGSGTAAATNGSAALVGTDTAFTTEYVEGGYIIIGEKVYTIDTIADDTNMTLTTNYAGGTDSGLFMYKVLTIDDIVELTGTISVVNGSYMVAGDGTSFLTQCTLGDSILIAGVIYVIEEVISDTSLKLTATYAGTTDSGLKAVKVASGKNIVAGSGLVTVTNGSANIVGFGTNFTTEFEEGKTIVLEGVAYTIDTITDDTHIVLSTNYAGVDAEDVIPTHAIAVNFTSTTSGTFEVAVWDFGDGTISLEANPTHEYTNEGTYVTTLTTYTMPKMTGTLEVTYGEDTVVGAGTSFTTELAVGETLIIAGLEYVIDTITDDTHMTLATVYKGQNHSEQIGIRMTEKLTGTIAVTQNSKDVVGTTTTFTTDYVEGGAIVIEGIKYIISTIADNTHMTLMNKYGDTTDSGLDNFKTTAKFTGTNGINSSSQIVIIGADYTVDLVPNTSDNAPVLAGLKEMTGTVSVTNGLKSVVGVGTLFTTELNVGETVVIGGEEGVIDSIATNLSLQLVANYPGDTDSGLILYQKTKVLTGTMSITTSSKDVVGVGTKFTTELIVGMLLDLEGTLYLIAEIEDDTNLTLLETFGGESIVGGVVATNYPEESTNGVVPATINFGNGSDLLDGEALWDFGDGAVTTKTGTLTLEQASDQVVGDSTLFTSEFTVGQMIKVAGLTYVIESIEDDTHMTLTSVYAGVDTTGEAFSLQAAGTQSTDASPSFTFTEAGTYTVRVTIVVNNESVTTMQTITVKATADEEDIQTAAFEVAAGVGTTILIGTLQLAAGSNIVIGSNTDFQSQLEIGSEIVIGGVKYNVEAIQSATQMTLTTVYTGGRTIQVDVSGSVAVTNGSDQIVGTGTSFVSELTQGTEITIDDLLYTVESVEDDFNATLSYPVGEATEDGKTVTKTLGVTELGVTASVSTLGQSTALGGTISVIQGSTLVVGIGTTFTTDLQKGMSLVINGVPYKVLGIISDTKLMLSKPYVEEDESGLPFYVAIENDPAGAISFVNTQLPNYTGATGTLALINDSVVVVGTGTLFTSELSTSDRIRVPHYTVRTGVVALTTSSDQLVGTGTLFLTELSPLMTILAGGEEYVVESIQDNTTATLRTVRSGGSQSGLDLYQRTGYDEYGIADITDDLNMTLSTVYAGDTVADIPYATLLTNTYFWDFGDGTYSNESNPIHVYSSSGTYLVRLTVTNTAGVTTTLRTVEYYRPNFYSVDHKNNRINGFYIKNGVTKYVKNFGSFGNGKGQFNNPEEIVIVGRGRKQLDGYLL